MLTRTFIALANEAGIAAEHLAIGVTALGRANYAQRAYYGQAFFALSVGIERTCKLAIVTDYALAHGGQFPDSTTLRRYGHDLRSLVREVSRIQERRKLDGYSRPTTTIHEDVIKVLSDFASNVTRYYNFDALAGVVAKSDPLATWSARVTDAVVEAHVSERRLRDIAFRAGQVGALLEGVALVRHTSEAGDSIASATDASYRTGIREAARPWEQLYVLQIARFLGGVLSNLSFEAQRTGNEDIPFYSEFYGPFNNDDRYLRSRKTWSIYGR